MNAGQAPQDRPDDTEGPLLTEAAEEVFTALADRTRRRILVRIADRPDDAGAIARDLDVSRQAVAKHLRVLEQSGLVSARMTARRRVHAVAPERIREVSDLLGVVARGWDRRLADVKELAELRERGRAADRTGRAGDGTGAAGDGAGRADDGAGRAIDGAGRD